MSRYSIRETRSPRRTRAHLASLAILALGLICFCIPSGADAQQAATATLRGIVRDQRGAVIAGAQVSAKQKSVGISRETTTDAEGSYGFSNLPPGSYEIQIQAEGFASKTSTPPVILQVGQTVTLDADLEVGQLTHVEPVFGGTPPVDTSSSAVAGTVDARDIQSLPLNGRNYLELALLIPGNTPAPNFDPTKTNTVVISSAGQLGRGGNVTVDGADNNDDVVGGSVQNISQEAVQEFQIATNLFSAELGRSGSSVINVITRSGTNEFHGSASVFFRDRRLQGLPATFDRSLAEEPPFDRQQYAFAIGGPIKTDRAFFFGSVEYRNQDGAALVGERDVASRSIRKGFASAPLNDLLSTERVDWRPTEVDNFTFRFSLQREDDIAPSSLIRAIGSASERQSSTNHTYTLFANYTRLLNARAVNSFNFHFSHFQNRIVPVVIGPQLTFPSIQDGASFRVPQATRQRRFQFSDVVSLVRGNHTLRFGGDIQRVRGDFDLGVFQQGRVELIEDFPDFDRNLDGRVDDSDLLFAVTLQSAFPTRPLLIPDNSNTYFAAFFQDDWRIHPQVTLNLGLRYELDTDVKNISHIDELNPLVLPFLRGTRGKDKNNFGPRFGVNYSSRDSRTSFHAGYGIYYDRITLEIQSLERGLDGRALPVVVRPGNLFFIDPLVLFNPALGTFPPGAPTLANPFVGDPIPGAGAGGINIIDNDMQNPMVQQMNVGFQRELGGEMVLRADYLHNYGTHFIIGRTIGQVFNPVVGGPDFIKNLESSVRTKYDGLLMSLEKRFSHRSQFRASYTFSRSFNYANDDQIPFSNGSINPNNLQLEYGPTPNDQRHRFTFAGSFDLPYALQLSPILTIASGVPMDILVPDGSQRIPQLQRNAGGRVIKSAGELNQFLTQVNAAGGFDGQPLPLISDDARFTDNFNSLDLRLARTFKLRERVTVQPIAEVFNLFNVTNVLGVSNSNYSGFSNVLVRDSNDSESSGFLRSSSFGRPVTTAGGVFGSGGPRAFQFAVRVGF